MIIFPVFGRSTSDAAQVPSSAIDPGLLKNAFTSPASFTRFAFLGSCREMAVKMPIIPTNQNIGPAKRQTPRLEKGRQPRKELRQL
jgi:hypothetical protein